jgi:hypothetical protein
MDLVILFLILFGMGLLMMSWLKADLQCPAPKVIYRYVPKHTLDVQFGQENKPSVIYNDMFTQGPPWIGGYQIGYGKTQAMVQAQPTQAQPTQPTQAQPVPGVAVVERRVLTKAGGQRR